ncbi:MAG: winged helix-turn-helix domain-containing protein [Acidimicrobiales bacterium]
MPERACLSHRQARWLAVAAQGLAAPRTPASSRPAGAGQLRRLLARVGTIQLDAINVVERTQFLVPFSRLGSYRRSDLLALTGPGAPWFEYWGHAASLLPVELHPCLRWKMERWRGDRVDGPVSEQRRRAWREAHFGYLASLVAEVTDRGPLTAGQLSDPRRRAGEWWDRRSDGRRGLELLFGDGVLAAWRSATFERVYDLTERVIPKEVLDRPTPADEEAQRELIALAASCLGVATVADLADYFWVRPAQARARVSELVEEGRLVAAEVEGWARAGYVVPGARPRRPGRAQATLLSPFDSLIWTRGRTERLFGFHYRIEVYVPRHLRRFGYYVMPLLAGDQLVARFDLKADRRAGALLVASAHGEPGADQARVVGLAIDELDRLRSWLGLGRLCVGSAGNLAPDLRRAAGGQGRTRLRSKG